MCWTYLQRSGELLDPAGKLAAIGYSGMGPEKNDPAAQNIPNMGPLPVGRYTINAPFNSPKLGPWAMYLTPDPANQEFGRGGFFMHGDSIAHPGCASEGCIVMPEIVRQAVWASGDRELQVISGQPIEWGDDMGEGE